MRSSSSPMSSTSLSITICWLPRYTILQRVKQLVTSKLVHSDTDILNEDLRQRHFRAHHVRGFQCVLYPLLSAPWSLISFSRACPVSNKSKWKCWIRVPQNLLGGSLFSSFLCPLPLLSPFSVVLFPKHSLFYFYLCLYRTITFKSIAGVTRDMV